MQKFYLSVLFLFILLLPNENFGQNEMPNKSMTKRFLWPYTCPEQDNLGPMDVLVSGTYYFVRETMGSTTRVNIQWVIDKITFNPMYGDLRYKYKGKIYKANEVAGTDGQDAMIGWRDIRIRGIHISITAVGLENAKRFNLNSSLRGTVDIGNVTKDKDLNSLYLEQAGSYATEIYYENEYGLQGRLDEMMKLVENRKEYKK